MNALTNVQTIYQDGKPAFVVVPYADYVRQMGKPWVPEDDGVPHEVVKMTIGGAMSQARAWREYLGLTQEEVANRLGISQSALAQMEAAKRPRRPTLEKLAAALGIRLEQLA